MKPDFALKLSNDGIELLHRTTGGWTPVGAVDFETDDVATRCAALVAQASALAPGGFRTKLVLPDSELRYVSVVAPGPTDEARRYQIEAEIERLTPYRIEELAYDWVVEDDSALVVIAARETLIEAETFAEGYGFNPVSFVALPAAGQFLGEPFFGETLVAPALLAKGDHVQPDADPVRVVKARPAPPPEKAPEKAPAPAAAAAGPAAKPVEAPKPEAPKPDAAKAEAPKIEAPKVEAPKVEAPKIEAPKAASPAPDLARTEAAKPDLARPAPPVAPPAPVAGRPAPSAAPAQPAADARAGTEAESAASRVGSLVRRMGTRLRREQAETRKAEAPARPVAAPLPALGSKTGDRQPAAPSAASTAGADAPAAFAHRPLPSRVEGDRPDGSAPAGGVTQTLDKPATGTPPAPRPAPAPTPPLAPAAAEAAPVAFASRRRTAPVVAASGPAPAKTETPGGRIAVLPGKPAARAGEGAQRLLARARNALAGATATAAARAARSRPPAAAKAGASGVAAPVPWAQPGGLAARPAPGTAPGTAPSSALASPPVARPWRAAPTEAIVPASRPPASDREKEREAEALTIFGARGAQRGGSGIAGRGLMAVGGVLLLLVAVAIWAVYFNGGSVSQLAGGSRSSDPVVAPASQAALPGIEAPGTIARAGDAVVVPEALPAPATASDTAADVASEATTGAEAPAALLAEDAPAAAAPDPDQMLEALVQEALDETLPTETLPVETPGAPEEPAIAEAPAVESPEPDTAVAEVDSAAPAEVGQTAAATATADVASGVAGDGRDSPQLASGASVVQSLSLPGSIQVPPTNEVAFVTPPPPPPFGTEFTFDERGLVEATPDGALTPSGVTVFAGRPDVAPAPRPASIAPVEPVPAAAEQPAGQPAAEAPAAVTLAAPEPSTEPVASAIESAIAEAVGEALPETAVPETAAAEAPATETAAEAPPVIADDTPRADPALAGARPLPRPERVRAIGEQLEAERQAEDDQTSLAAPGETETAALADPAAAAAESATATRASDAVTDLAALQTPTPGGLALAALRPQRRPTDLAPEAAPEAAEAEATAAAPELDLSGATPEAVAQSPVPGERPDDIAERARAILAAASAANASASAGTADDDGVDEPPARSADPVIPSSASVARQATEDNAIRLNRVNLIGVFGSPNDRRALVRMSNGRVVRVQVGDRLDGGQVAAIGEAELVYVKNGRNEVLRIGG